MKKTKKLFCLFLAVAIGICGAAPVSANDGLDMSQDFNMTENTVTFVEWSDTYDSAEEMIEKSDVNIIGTVISQEVEQRHDLYFTHSYVEDECGEIYDVLQTGAIIENTEINIPYDSTILELNEDYFLCLNQTEYDDTYGQYYLIAGGNKGEIKYSEMNLLYSKFEKDNDYQLQSIDSTDLIPYFGYYWNKSTIYYYLSSSIKSNYGSNMVLRIETGLKKWNNKGSIRISSTSSSTSADVLVFMNDYGATNWNGLHRPTLGSDPHPTIGSIGSSIEMSQISLNTYYRGSNSTTFEWQAIACHEMGHSLGLNHATESQKANSIMNGDSGSPFYYTYHYTEPQTIDSNTVEVIYP